jgi:hypothetical protein
MLCLFGKQAREVWRHPSTSGVLIGIGFALLWLGMTFALQRWATKRSNNCANRKASLNPVPAIAK